MYDERYLGRLVFESFRHSQGSAELQKQIFAYLAAHYEPSIDLAALSSTSPAIADRIRRYIGSPEVHPSNGFRPEFARVIVTTQYANFHRAVERVRQSAHEHHAPGSMAKLVGELLERTLWQDYKHMASGPGRSRAKPEESVLPGRDSRYLSHIVYYGLERQSTGLPEYDAMFRDMAALIPGCWDCYVNPEEILGVNITVGQSLQKIGRRYYGAYPAARAAAPPAVLQLIEYGP